MNQSDQFDDEESELSNAEVQRRMVELARKLGETCEGQTFQVMQGALAHLQAQLIMRMYNNDIAAISACIDHLAAAMKDDIRLNVEHMQRHEAH